MKTKSNHPHPRLQRWAVALIGLSAVSFTACTPTQRGAAIGGLGGAALGAAIDDHNPGRGALIGGAGGAAAGALIGSSRENNYRRGHHHHRRGYYY